ncbi:rhomboid-like protein [Anaeramoeba flamelloides]|uniref:rhomboid protease n=1 Tax=Anaeramoeba flamelloides TaxID=1746091 RepID=A0AAV7YB12_9EUKA|nr:rhomboid-like protein [Anaeramoeba flamelloides]KAJ6241489.1 rhomboid-like protein [Anaeramoeba flamelloides]
MSSQPNNNQNSDSGGEYIVERKMVIKDPFWSRNIGEDVELTNGQKFGLVCCPCCVGPCRSEERKNDFQKMKKLFMFWVTIVDLIYFVIELFACGFASPSKNATLGPPSSCLNDLGARDSEKIVSGHVYRLIVPVIMHSGFIHIFFNLFVQVRVCFAFETVWGTKNTAIIYIVSGVGGNLLSTIMGWEYISVGASGAICGLFGARLIEIIVTWNKTQEQIRKINLIQCVLVLILVTVIGLIGSIDFGAHFGGVLYGIAVSSVLFAENYDQPTKKKKLKIFGYVFLSLLTVLFVILIGTVTRNRFKN